MKVNSPFRYPGGKFYARRLILEHIPSHTRYIEPFAGGASIFFAKPKVESNWLNDLDEELINVYLHIRDYPNELIDRLKGEKAEKERHYFYKNTFESKTPLDRAVRWYYLNRTSYSGIMKPQNCYWGYGDKFSMRPENWPRNILRTSRKLQSVKITCLDFEQVITGADDGSFLFIDPPYYNRDQDKFYIPTFTREDHERLCALLKKHSARLRFLVTYDNDPTIKSMYSWAKAIYDKEWNYTINRTDDQRKSACNGNESRPRYKGQEIFIVNFESPDRLGLFEQLV